ncbi:MAG: hypothetical protein E6Y02_00155 [Gemella haemolysans]|uniref:hypothetical protein n=1 Tax=Gemella haemolysans TaxID=1379 RepID=UPI0029109679|nr:hypothetical protein [Gemella haemolysans]MDU4713384.1 hypothetical protein [Gemella haemolysans]
MVKRDKKFELLLKEFIETEGKNFSNKEDAIEVFEHIYNMVKGSYDVDGPLGDIVDVIDDSDMSVFNKVNALRELYEENHSGIEMAIELGEDILYSESDKDTEEMILADALAGYYVKAGMYEEAAKLYELLLKASPSDFSEVTDELTHVYVSLNRDDLMRNHIKRFDYLESEPTLLLLSAFSINQGKLDEAHYYMTKLKELNKYTGIIFKGGFEKVESFIEGTLQDEKDLQKNEVFEMHFAANIAKDYLTSKYHYELLEKLYKEEIEKRVILIVEGRLNISKEMMKENPIFAGMERQLNKFIGAELYNKEIIESYTEKELKKLGGIGATVIQKLKNNGVKFKKD